MKVDPQGDRRRMLRRRRKRDEKGSRGEPKPGADAEPEDEESVSDVELQEFLEADRGPVPVSPRFREALRERLWRIVKVQAGEIRRRRKDPDDAKPPRPTRRDVARRRGDD